MPPLQFFQEAGEEIEYERSYYRQRSTAAEAAFLRDTPRDRGIGAKGCVSGGCPTRVAPDAARSWPGASPARASQLGNSSARGKC